jgi:hypothetical protein
VPDLRTSNPDAGRATLELIAERATAWFPLAMEPVADRYRRRMRGVALATAAAVVLALNADALTIFRQAQTNDEFRQQVSAATEQLTGLQEEVREFGDRCLKASPEGAASSDTACAALAPALDSLNRSAVQVAAHTGFLDGITGPRRPRDPEWWMGILLSTLLVSLGAPFWHDLLETMFGVKNRVRAQAEKMEATTPPLIMERVAGPHAEAVITGPADEKAPV